ncbi:exonuclease domain-containing protein [Oscillatoriales cyanobacterium LEGE 11467]|uniref:Exonuclease domain-containing protein n=1 Tax=Zarconia navalis LEGE 11467 TaxID=1828826 RepID=A0A928VY88_9CYAN|nr:3'-5' exonuclease [Zarconia navalis]MBE9040456.1 exonuclease domain-containing protein [Zarconia navalis LEGE 11467]
MNLKHYDYLMVLDLEATCCDRKTISRNQMEIIEMGAVMVETQNLTPVDEFQTFVKPTLNPQLTEFCRQLTSISQAQVDRAPTYPEAAKHLQSWLARYPNFLFGSWGDYDRKQFEQDSKFHDISYPIASVHINLKKFFSTNQGFKKRYGMAQALELAGISLEGTHHRGIDDARNIAKLLPYIFGIETIANI